MEFIKKSWKGFLLCLCIAIPAWFLGQLLPVIGGPVFAILAGMVITLFGKNKDNVQPGITFTSKKILQYAVILLGFGMNLTDILMKWDNIPCQSFCPPFNIFSYCVYVYVKF